MFQFLGTTVTRTWPVLLGVWAIFLIGTEIVKPPWADVAQDKEFTFLPVDAPSRRGEELFEKAFPEDRLGSNVVLVVRRVEGEAPRVDQDKKFIEDVLEPALRKIAEDGGGLASELTTHDEPLFAPQGESRPPAAKSIIARIRTPNAPGAGALLVSPDSKAMLVVVELTTEFLSRRNWPIVGRVEELIDTLRRDGKLPQGMEILVAGSAVIGRDRAKAQTDTARAIELLTIVLVVVLLLLIYRAPLLALMPLITVYLAVRISLNLLAILAQAGYVNLFQGIEIYVTILSYGAGVDYCLFLTARYKEELDQGASPREATSRAISNVGAALTASAGTVMFGIGMMVFAQFGKFHEAGIVIPLGLFLVLCATLTFSSSVLCLVGRWAFWPQTVGQGQVRDVSTPTGFWSRLLHAEGLHRKWEKIGEILLRRPGTIWLVTVAVMAPFALVAGILYNHLSYDMIGNLPPDAPSVVGTRTLQKHFPAGIMGPVTVVLVNPHVDFGKPEGRALVEELTNRLRERKEELGLYDVRSLTAPLGFTESTKQAFEGLKVSREALQEALDREARDHYVTDFGERAKIGTRLDLILEQSPFSRESVENLEKVAGLFQAALPPELQRGSELSFVGPTASIRDLQIVVQGDRLRIEVLVLASVFLILVVLLRKLVVSLYLIVSVLFSYYATLGVAFAVFWALDPHGFSGIDWKVAIFLFTILIAVGEDYNIFLMTRIDEEQKRHGPMRGITHALSRTGPIISSCGIIMAGTFASLLAASLSELKQLGFALAFGVLLDTFVVRPILVPAFLILLGSGRLRLSMPRPKDRAPYSHTVS